MEEASKKHRNYTSEGIPQFVDKLDSILSKPQYSDIISWSSDGRAFLIKNVTAFTDSVLPLFYNHNKYSSFIRQLNMYNFSKIRSDEAEHVYANEYFLRDHKQLFKNIHRRVVGQNGRGKGGQLVLKTSEIKPKAYSKQLQDISKKQAEMEMICMKLLRENQNLISQNAKMWKKISRRLQKKDRNIEKLIYFLLLGNNQTSILDGETQLNALQSLLQTPRQNNKLLLEDQDSLSEDSNDSFEEDEGDEDIEPKRGQKITNSSIMNLLTMLGKKKGKKLLQILLEDSGNLPGLKKKKSTFTIIDPQNHQLNGVSQIVLPKPTENLCIKQNGESSKSNSPKAYDSKSVVLQPPLTPIHLANENPLDSSILSEVLFMNPQNESAQHQDVGDWLNEN